MAGLLLFGESFACLNQLAGNSSRQSFMYLRPKTPSSSISGVLMGGSGARIEASRESWPQAPVTLRPRLFDCAPSQNWGHSHAGLGRWASRRMARTARGSAIDRTDFATTQARRHSPIA